MTLHLGIFLHFSLPYILLSRTCKPVPLILYFNYYNLYLLPQKGLFIS